MDFRVSAILLIFSFLLPFSQGATFTFVNKCQYTVWPGILSNAGSPPLDSTGFELPTDTSRSFLAPTGWSGRFWGRTGCTFSSSHPGICTTGDCGSGTTECSGAGAAPPATLAEFTLSSTPSLGQDFYDVSLVDGYNLPILVQPSTTTTTTSSSSSCAVTGCVVDVNRLCPNELRVGDGEACKSACEAFGSPEYCCSGAYGSPATCKPSVYSQVFKSACPRSYSYAYDDATSTFTCGSGADYTITFCPSASPSQKSTTPIAATTPTTTPPTTIPPTTPPTTIPPTTPTFTSPSDSGSGSEFGYGGSMNYDDGSSSAATGGSSVAGTGGEFGSSTGSGGSTPQSTAMLGDGSWLANMAMGDAAKTVNPTTTFLTLLLVTVTLSLLSSSSSSSYLL